MTILGEGWYTPPDPVEKRREVTVESLQSEQLLLALAALQDALSNMPAPVVHVSEPDLSGIVNAVNGLKGPATAEEIARAIRDEISPAPRPEMDETLNKLTESLERLDFRMQGLSSGGGGGTVGSRVQNVDGTNLSTTDAMLDTRYDWQAQGGASVPLYIGTAAPGTATSAASWRIDKYTYIAGPAGDSVPSVVQTTTGAWDNRATLF